MIKVTNSPIDAEAITAGVQKDTNGAIVTFLGTTRSKTGDRKVLYLEYEAYQAMVHNVFQEIVAEIGARWMISDVSIVHRIGRLEVKDISLVVAVGSPHRAQAFSACQYVVDRIKQSAPIWKKEVFEGGEVWVESPEDLDAKQKC